MVGVRTDKIETINDDILSMSGSFILVQKYVLLIYYENYVEVCVKETIFNKSYMI